MEDDEDVADSLLRVPRLADTSDPREAEIVGAAGAVVVGIDGSEADGPVTDWAADEARRLGAPLRMVHVIDPDVHMTSYEVLASGSPRLTQRLTEDAHHLLEAACTRARARHPALDIAVSMQVGRAEGALVRLSDGARRVVIGGPPSGRLERILGSVALPVVAHAHCPVVVVPAGASVLTPQRIVVGVDGSEGSGRAVAFALSTAEACGAALTCVVVWTLEVEDGVVVTERSSPLWPAVERRYEELGHHTVDRLAAWYPTVEVSITVRHGPPAKAILEAGADLNAGLVVVGSRGRGGFRGLLLGSVSRRIVEHAGRVVAIVH